jgi:AAA+ superfamily predicted ATPase
MRYYKIEATMTNMKEIDNDRQQTKYAIDMGCKFDLFFQKHDKKVYAFISNMRDETLNVGCIVAGNYDINDIINEFLQDVGISVDGEAIQEITFRNINSMLFSATRNSYIRDEDVVLAAFNIDCIDRSVNYEETIDGKVETKAQLKSDAKALLCEGSLCPEIDRIFLGSKKTKVCGNPVHYVAISDDVQVRDDMVKTLHTALYSVKRLTTQRYCTITIFPDDRMSKKCLDSLYASCEGGLVYVKLLLNDEEESDVKKVNDDIIEVVCNIMQKYKNKTLTVFGINRKNIKIKDKVYSHLGNATMVELNEEIIFGVKAKNYLKMLAKNAGVKDDINLYRCVENEERGYLGAELNKEFDYWFNNKLKTEVYPQYKQIESVDKGITKSAPKGSAYDELQRMIGLTEAKKVINQALTFYKAQKLFKQKGMVSNRPAMHMVFTGNPGTAKTTVARLFASIMRDNGILSRGDLYEVGRADIVGKYVGSTAPLVKSVFKKAMGSVLFIDEAYSLVDDKTGLYGDEAINTIVQEMENNRDELVVIFAGYPDKMEEFLSRNPGLRSRIAFHVNFDDYTSEELVEISSLIAEGKGLKLNGDAKEKLLPVFEEARKDDDFGNGRYARNIIEKAQMQQAERLVKMDFDSVTRDDIETITADDIVINGKKNVKSARVGF